MSGTTHDTDVLVLGGGLMGTTAAFFLRHEHGLSVTLLERELVGRQASGTNFGNVRRQGRALAQMPLANRARAVWGRVKELLGEDLEFVPYGHLRVCYTEKQAAVLEQHAKDVKPLGLDLELFSAEQLRRRWGIFAPEVVRGSLSPNDGHANPRLAGPAFARAARRAGANIVEHAEVMHVERDGTGFVAHTADGRRFRAPQLLVRLRRLVEPHGRAVRRSRADGRARPADGRDGTAAVRDRPVDRRVVAGRARGPVLPPDRARQHRLRRRAQGPGRCRHASAPT